MTTALSAAFGQEGGPRLLENGDALVHDCWRWFRSVSYLDDHKFHLSTDAACL
jgi:hypothetical protein